MALVESATPGSGPGWLLLTQAPTHLLPGAAWGPAAPSCTGSRCPAAACRTGPARRSAWAGSHQRRRDVLEQEVKSLRAVPRKEGRVSSQQPPSPVLSSMRA